MRENERWQKQTSFGGPDSDDPGNCWACCIAGMLRIQPEEVPEGLRLEKDDDKRWKIYKDFLKGHGYSIFNWDPTNWIEENWNLFWEQMGDALIHISGDSPRGEFKHGVVYKNGELFFDPHPSGDGVLKITGIEFLIPIDPSENFK